MIPMVDLVAQYRSVQLQIDDAIRGVLERGVFIMGPNVEAFEQEIAAYIGVKHAIGMNSGTDALHLALRALGIGPNDEVITSPFTFIATTEAIGIVGARPVFVDINPQTFNIDASLIEEAITSRTKAILPVHLYGAPADMPGIRRIARQHNLAVIEDCAQAIGAQLEGQHVGTMSDVGCFSFFPSKNLGAYGDAGLATTDDDKLAERLRMLRTHGGRKKYHHDELGVNSRLDEIQAAILRVKLPHLNSWIDARRRIAATYTNAFRSNRAITTPAEEQGHVYHQYTIRVNERDRLHQHLTHSGIQAMIYYPVPLHQQEVHKDLSSTIHRTLQQSEKASKEVLSLPMYPELSAENQDVVTASVLAATTEMIPS